MAQTKAQSTPEPLPKRGFVAFATQAEAESYLRNLDGYSGRAYPTEGGKWGVSFHRAEAPDGR